MRDLSAKARVADRAGKQIGRITWAQMVALGVPSSTIGRWVADGFLYRKLPTVYAVGHPGTSPEADLFSAVLYAGPHAGLGGMSAGLWRGLVKWRTAEEIEVWTPRRRRSLEVTDPLNTLGIAVEVRTRRTFTRQDWKGIPTVPIPQIVLALARTEGVDLVRFVLANMDYLRLLDERALRKQTGPGIPGSTVLTEALGRPQPLLARTRSWFEVRLILVCELTGMRLPDDTNVEVAGYPVDAVWWDEMVVVECDGEGNHGTFRQRRRDLGEDMALRALGFLPIRYTTDKLEHPSAVEADLGAQLEQRRGLGRVRVAG